ncbi:hypothetical protein BVIET440_100199 [Burkholderia vietnamiensis]
MPVSPSVSCEVRTTRIFMIGYSFESGGSGRVAAAVDVAHGACRLSLPATTWRLPVRPSPRGNVPVHAEYVCLAIRPVV